MKWNKHSAFEGLHAFMGASKFHWINYEDERLLEAYKSYRAAEEGTATHEFASLCIQRKQKLPNRPRKTLDMFVNDAIGFRMDSEVMLFYSEYCFGTADAISFYDNHLQIHDLKTGKIPAHIEQLIVYAALFCLEYDKTPGSITIELRIYQNNDILICKPEADDILPVMDKIKRFDNLIRRLEKAEE